MCREIVCVDMKNKTIYDTLREGENRKELLARAYNDRDSQILGWESTIQCYPELNAEGTYTNKIKELDSIEYKVMTKGDYNKLVQECLDLQELEFSEEEFSNGIDYGS